MTEDADRGGPGAGVEDRSMDETLAPPYKDCPRCAELGHGREHFNPDTRRPNKRHTNNGKGRPIGRPNDTTILANQRLKSAADRAAQVIEQGLNSTIDWVRYGAAKTILERTLPKDQAPDPIDAGWMDFLTNEELEQLTALIAKGRERQERQEQPEDSGLQLPAFAGIPLPGGGEVIDVTPDQPATSEPEPEAEPAEPEQPDYEEFGE